MSAWKRDARPGSDGVTLYLEQDPQLGPFDQHWQRTARYDETVDFRPVDVITGLCIYSGTECLTSKILCKLLGQSLINLRWLRHEKSFDEVAFYDTNSFEPEYVALVEKYLPRTLRHMILFREWDDETIWSAPRFRSLVAALAKLPLTFPIQKLCASYMFDASDFFCPLVQLPSHLRYVDLEYLALTTKVFSPYAAEDSVGALLKTAGEAVFRRMPKLRVMELWNDDDDDTCVFRYKAHEKWTEVNLVISWDVDLTTVWNTWDQLVNETRPHQPLKVQIRRLGKSESERRGYLSKFLEFQEDIMGPRSLTGVGYLEAP